MSREESLIIFTVHTLTMRLSVDCISFYHLTCGKSFTKPALDNKIKKEKRLNQTVTA